MRDEMNETVALWSAADVRLDSERPRTSPYWEVDVRLRLGAPDGSTRAVDCFWDGGSVWRGRFKPDQLGQWSWRSIASDETDAGLHGQAGTIECVANPAAGAVAEHGPVRIADDGWSFAHQDGTPFLWLGDTAWNGLLRSTPEEWEAYLGDRSRQGFSVVQFFSTTWRALPEDAHGRAAFSRESGRLEVDPDFYRDLDDKVAAIERHGMLASAIVVLALFDDEPAWTWTEDELVRFSRWLRARWDAYHVAWSIAGDGDFRSSRSDRWRRVGPRISTDPVVPLVTLHPMGWTWILDDFHDDTWFTFVTYQSGHSDRPERVAWLPQGPPATGWQGRLPRPIVNIEPNYEDHPAGPSGRRFTAYEVRRAAYWSLFVTPTAGVSYGHYSLWAWASERERVGAAIRGQEDQFLEPWHTVLSSPGARSMSLLRDFLESGRWWTLRPAQDVVVGQPGDTDPLRHVMASRGEDGAWVAIYAPVGGVLRVREESLPRGRAHWFDPRDGSRRTANGSASGGVVEYRAPDDQDWLLDLRATARVAHPCRY